jgi:multidrug efflux pump subunit AcrB
MSTIDPGYDTRKGLIAWFARNPVAAGLLMILIIATGLYSAFTIKKEIMPIVKTRVVKVTQIYPGAAPSEVEKGIILKIEEAIKDLNGIKRIESRAFESLADVSVEVKEYFDVDTLLNEIKIQIDSIATFPSEAEKPVISRVDWISHAVQLQLHGVDEFSGKWLSEEIKQELLALDNVGRIAIYGTRDREITIEVDESLLRKYGLTLSQVAHTISRASIDVPAGSIRASSGDILLRTSGQAYDQKDFERIVLLTWPDGTRLTLSDIATIKDAFVEAEGFAMFDGDYSIGLVAYAMGKQDVIDVARTVKAYAEQKAATLPEGVTLDYWADTTFYLNQRLTMMLRNLALGAVLVFLTLAMFLELRMAFWVMVGLPICFLGTLALMPLDGIDISINMLSLFGFILVLGIVVDDAIVIGESVHATTARHGHTLDNVILGAQRVAMPATFGVLTTIAAFAPTLYIDGIFASMLRAFGVVVILCLLFSLVESKWILPAHLAHINHGLMRFFYWSWQDRLQQRNNVRLDALIQRYYEPFLRYSLRERYTTVASFLAAMILVFGLISAGWIRYVMVADNAGDYLQVNLEMARGTPDHKTLEAIKRIQAGFAAVEDEYRREQGSDMSFAKHLFNYGRDGRIGFFMAELTHPDERALDAREIIERWRDRVGDIPGARVLSFSELDRPGAKDLVFNLVSNNPVELDQAAVELTAQLSQYNGVYDIENGAADLVNEIHLQIKPAAEALGLTLADLGRQVRDAFHGAEVQRLQRGNDEIKVLVRYPPSERTQIANLENMYIRAPDGSELPLLSVAELSFRPAPAQTLRVNREASIPVTAQVNKTLLEPRKVVAEISGPYFDELSQKYPSVSFRLDGDALESTKMESSMASGFALALFAIYALLAIPLRSYFQPLMVMSVIPFGIIGAAIGHLLMGGMPLSMMSFMGIIALSGVVVNDSLILVDFVNRSVHRGVAVSEAVVTAACRRFRAILLTSMTTFLGILPILLEPSVEAQFLVPMAVALGFGIVFSTVITLVMVPNLYLIGEDVRGLIQRLLVLPSGEQEGD